MVNPGFPGSGVFRGFRDSGIWPFSGIPGEGPSSGQIRDLAGSWPDPGNPGSGRGPGIRGFRGPESGFSGSRNPGKKHTFRDDGFSCIQQLGPGFWTFFSKTKEIWGPGQKFRGPRDPQIWPFSGSPGTPDPDPRFGRFPGFPQISQISQISPDFPDFPDFPRFRDFGYPGPKT